MATINRGKHVWEGWTVGCFIDDLEPVFNMIQRGESVYKKFTSKDLPTLKKWLMDSQPYYKKHIPGVYNYFKQKLK